MGGDSNVELLFQIGDQFQRGYRIEDPRCNQRRILLELVGIFPRENTR